MHIIYVILDGVPDLDWSIDFQFFSFVTCVNTYIVSYISTNWKDVQKSWVRKVYSEINVSNSLVTLQAVEQLCNYLGELNFPKKKLHKWKQLWSTFMFKHSIILSIFQCDSFLAKIFLMLRDSSLHLIWRSHAIRSSDLPALEIVPSLSSLCAYTISPCNISFDSFS